MPVPRPIWRVTMDDILAEVLRLEEGGRYQVVVNYLLGQTTHPALLLKALAHLLQHHRFAAAGHLGDVLVSVGLDDPVAHLSCAIGAMMVGDQTKEVSSSQALARAVDRLVPEQQGVFYHQVVSPALFHITQIVHKTQTAAELLRVLEILKAAAPRFRQMFDWSAEADARRAGAGFDRASLITYRSPPADTGPVPYRVVVAMRDKMFSERASSRVFDVGPRFVDAARRYGWQAQFCPMSFMNLVGDFAAVRDHCLAFSADILILDDHPVVLERNHAARVQLFAELRKALPAIRIVGLHLDSWKIPPEFLRRTAVDLDAVWAVTPSMPHWSDPVFAGKLLLAPIVHTGDLHPPDETVPNRISFVGGLMNYNWHRIFWQAASIRDGLPIDWTLSDHMNDGLSPLDSYAGYMRRLARTGCSLNMAMRPDLSCVITDRSFEAPLAGTLLIQEESPDMDYFFVAGQHYLPYSSFAELRRIAEMVANEPNMVQAIRHAAHEFAVERYADEKLIGYLDALLFHPESAKTGH